MKQKYIVGDLVRISFISDDKIFEIIEGGTINPYIAKDMDGKEAIAEEHSIIPIPITPEILEKNGWKVYHRGTRFIFIIDDNSYIIIEWRNNEVFKAFLFRGAKYARLIDLLYVHQLQHLLFGLGLDSDMEV